MVAITVGIPLSRDDDDRAVIESEPGILFAVRVRGRVRGLTGQCVMSDESVASHPANDARPCSMSRAVRRPTIRLLRPHALSPYFRQRRDRCIAEVRTRVRDELPDRIAGHVDVRAPVVGIPTNDIAGVVYTQRREAMVLDARLVTWQRLRVADADEEDAPARHVRVHLGAPVRHVRRHVVNDVEALVSQPVSGIYEVASPAG